MDIEYVDWFASCLLRPESFIILRIIRIESSLVSPNPETWRITLNSFVIRHDYCMPNREPRCVSGAAWVRYPYMMCVMCVDLCVNWVHPEP